MWSITSRPIFRQYLVVIVVNLSVISTGLGLAWPSPVLVKLRNETETILPHPINEEQGSWVVSIGFLIATFANFLPVVIVDRIGRKFCIILGCLPKILASLLFLFASDVWMLLLGRSINGIGDCLVMTVVPMYASEVASKEIRGALGTILQIFCSIGILIMLSMGPFVSYITLNIILTCSNVITTIPLFFLHDSPYSLYAKGKTKEAKEVLTFLRGSEDSAKEEMIEYSKSNTDLTTDMKSILKNRIVLKGLAIVIVLGAGNQLIGFNAISFYLQTILESTQTSIRPEDASVVIGLIQLGASFCTASMTDRFGRKPILASSLVGMAFGMVGLGVFFKWREGGHAITGVMNYMPLVSLILVVYCFSAGCGSLYWIIITELFEGPVRAIGVSISLLVSTLFVFLTTKYFPLVTNALGPATTYWVFGVICILMCLFIVFCIPETKGKTFGEIQVALGAKDLNIDEDKSVEKKQDSGAC